MAAKAVFSFLGPRGYDFGYEKCSERPSEVDQIALSYHHMEGWIATPLWLDSVRWPVPPSDLSQRPAKNL